MQNSLLAIIYLTWLDLRAHREITRNKVKSSH
jgi:hypothetical protein